MYSVILCGGSGTRLWPLSRKNFPKQFLNLFSEKSLLQETYLRMREIMPKENIFFSTNKENLFNVFNQIKEVEKAYDRNQIFTEPVSRNTAPAIALAIKHLFAKNKISADEPIIFLPADHFIKDRKNYLEIVKHALENVGSHVGTIGITPTKPETGYGYIKKGQKTTAEFFVADEFKEKPDADTAQKYLESCEYVWNAGMYLFNVKTIAKEFKTHAPEIYSALTKGFQEFIDDFQNLPAISIDYAISEKSDNVIIFEGEFGWNDIGSFDSIAEMSAGAENPRHISIDSNNNFVHSESGRLVATIGVDDLNIVETADCVLIQKKGQGENVKKIVDHLKENGHKELEHNLLVHRPWGKYEVLIDKPSHKVKKITVYPGEILSLQMHHHRAEHWIVVSGVAKIVLGENSIYLKENESTFIPSMTKHRLENPGKINLEIIEIQTGSYMEENDIVRYDDVYNRIG